MSTRLELSSTGCLDPTNNPLSTLDPIHTAASIGDQLKTVLMDVKNSPPKMQDYPLPPPPPDPPFAAKRRSNKIRVDGVEVPIRDHIDRLKRKATTKSGVTQEARKVLEQFLKHSLQRGLKSPYSSEQQTQSEREYLDECPYMLLQSNESYYGSSYYGSAQKPGNSLEKKLEDMNFDEPDYAEPAEPDEEVDSEEFEQIPETQEDIDAALSHSRVTKTNSVSSQGSFCVSLRSHPASRSRSPSDRLFLSVHPPHIKGKNKGKPKKHKGLYDESSSSTEDYEYTESYLVRRKKKSFFKWASERLRQSFRRSSKRPVLLHEDLDSTKGSLMTESLPEELVDKSNSKSKKNKLKFDLKRHGSDKGSKSTHSSSTPNDVVTDTLQVHHEVAALSEGEIASYHMNEDVASVLEGTTSNTERHRKSPVPWKRHEIKMKKKANFPPEAVKDKGIFDSFLRHIRKGSSKLKRKGSKDDSVRQRSRSADNLVLRPISKEHEKVLQRYTRQKDPEYDSDNTTVRSFHEVVAHKVEQVAPLTPKPGVVWYPPPLPVEPPLSDDGGLLSLRQDMHLEGLVSRHQGDQQKDEVDGGVVHRANLHRIRPSESEDDIDGGHVVRKPRKKHSAPPLDITDKPFHERTELEKEELYEKIAEQLAAIADHYNFESPRSSKSLSSPPSHSHTHSRSHSNSAPSHSETEEGAVGCSELPDTGFPLEVPVEGADCLKLQEQLGLLLRDRNNTAGPAVHDIPPMMAELVRNASYSKFKQIFNENIGNEPGWQQIAMMFRLTQTAVQLAGFGTAAALQIKEMTLTYFEDQFAGWIIGQGGWESVVEDSELD